MPQRLFGVLGIFAIVGWGYLAPAGVAQDQQPTPAAATEVEEEDFGGLPPGPGREEVYYTCQACHSLAIVLQQRLSRDTWDYTLQWMIEEQGMPEPEPEEYARLLDYLGTYLSPDVPR